MTNSSKRPINICVFLSSQYLKKSVSTYRDLWLICIPPTVPGGGSCILIANSMVAPKVCNNRSTREFYDLPVDKISHWVCECVCVCVFPGKAEQ